MDEQTKDASVSKRNRDECESSPEDVLKKGMPALAISQKDLPLMKSPALCPQNRNQLIEILSSDDDDHDDNGDGDDHEKGVGESNQSENMNDNCNSSCKIDETLKVDQDIRDENDRIQKTNNTFTSNIGKATFEKEYFTYKNSAYVQNLAEICYDILHDG